MKERDILMVPDSDEAAGGVFRAEESERKFSVLREQDIAITKRKDRRYRVYGFALRLAD